MPQKQPNSQPKPKQEARLISVKTCCELTGLHYREFLARADNLKLKRTEFPAGPGAGGWGKAVFFNRVDIEANLHKIRQLTRSKGNRENRRMIAIVGPTEAWEGWLESMVDYLIAEGTQYESTRTSIKTIEEYYFSVTEANDVKTYELHDFIPVGRNGRYWTENHERALEVARTRVR